VPAPFQVSRVVRPAVLAVVVALAAVNAAAQTQMPDPSLIHGRALPAPELSTGTVTVRVVRQSIGNDAPDQTVRVTVGDKTSTATTDAMGRAEFSDLAVGQEGRATATVDGEAMESQPFTVPTSGGLRVILVAGIAEANARKAREAAEAAAAPATKGVVVFGGNSRVLMQFTDDSLQVYYVLDVVNNARARVDVGGPLVVDLPAGASSATALEGSSPLGTISGNRLTIAGPFPSGTTSVQIAYRMAYSSSVLNFVQPWPAGFERMTVGVEKVGTLTMSSPQLPETSEVEGDGGQVFVLGRGGALAAGTPLTVTLGNLPYRNRTPRYVALALAAGFIALGAWLAFTGSARDTSRQALMNRREALLQELAQLEVKRRDGAMSADRYAARRQRVLTELEHVLGELDQAVPDPQGGGEGVAA